MDMTLLNEINHHKSYQKWAIFRSYVTQPEGMFYFHIRSDHLTIIFFRWLEGPGIVHGSFGIDPGNPFGQDGTQLSRDLLVE